MMYLQDAGRTAIATAFAARPLFIAIGRGLPAWDATPQEAPTNATALVDEIGRCRVLDISYVVPDAAGAIVMPEGARYSASPGGAPTAWVLLRVTLDYADAAGEQVREMGLYIDGTVDGALPPGQTYFTAAQVTAPGTLYGMERRAVETRSGEKQTIEQIVVPF